MRLLSRCEPINGCGKTYPSDLEKCPHCGTPEAFSVAAPLDPRDWIYDIETFPNVFTAAFLHASTGLTQTFEISDRCDDTQRMIEFMLGLGRSGARGVGFNNLGFDYPVMHYIVANPHSGVAGIYAKAMSLIKSHDDDKFGSMIWDDQQVFAQMDLYKIWHFDNNAKRTSLKALEIVMRSRNVIDLPFPVGTFLTDEQKDVLIAYNMHDVRETAKFYARSQQEIHLREALSLKYDRNMLNMSNTKIGGTILVSQMEDAGIECYVRGPGGKQPRQTIRATIKLADVIFPYVKFERLEFTRVLEYFQSMSISQTKGTFADLTAIVDGFTFVFGVGGIHGSIESQTVASDDEYQIVDIDVKSMYPRIAIVNSMYPQHLGLSYCDIYDSIYEQRIGYKKGTPENAALKEALNASYGNSNNAYSPLYDPQYTMQTTINGQLMLCMLSEQLMKIPGLTMCQINTDGVTMRCPRGYLDHMRTVCRWWESVTKLELEEVLYNHMHIRDVNNYISVYPDGSTKRKGAYEYNTLWHQDPSAQVVARAAEAALVRGESIREFITNHRDPFDFMCRAKVPRKSTLHLRFPDWGIDQQLQGTTRYFVSRNGGTLVKVSPPTGEPGTWKRKAKISDFSYNQIMSELGTDWPNAPHCDSAGVPWDARIHTGNRSKHDTRETGICSGWRVSECADASHFDWSDIDYRWYIQEAEKLVNPLLTGSSR